MISKDNSLRVLKLYNVKNKILSIILMVTITLTISACTKQYETTIKTGGIINEVDYETVDKIACISYASGRSQIYIMNSDGTNIKNISNNDHDEFGFSWSPDGSKLAFTSDYYGKGQIFIINSDNTARQNLSDEDHWYGYPTWSPDGSKIAFVSGEPEIIDGQANLKGQINIMKNDGTEKRNLSGNILNDWYPTWSPDGSEIAFVSYKNNIPQIFTMNPDGSERKNLSNNDSDELYPTWSPDGSKIAFVSTINGFAKIFIMDMIGNNRKNITGKDFAGTYPSWSPKNS